MVPLVQFTSCFLPQSAMSVIGFSEDEIRQVLEVTTLVLKLGNVKLTDEFQANGIPASGISDGKGWCHPAGACSESPYPEASVCSTSHVIDFTWYTCTQPLLGPLQRGSLNRSPEALWDEPVEMVKL